MSELSLQELLETTGGQCVNLETLSTEFQEPLQTIKIRSSNRLASTREGDVAFFFSKHYEPELKTASPSVLVTAPSFIEKLTQASIRKCALVSCPNPTLAMAQILERLAPIEDSVSASRSEIHATAVVHTSVRLGQSVKIGPYCVVEAGVVLGDRVTLDSHVFIGSQTTLGNDVRIFSHVTLYPRTVLGNRVRIHANGVIGADGFGYVFDPREKKHIKISHLGRVVIEDEVEIGAGSCIDRATVGETRIRRGTKIDNLVQIGHNVDIGEGAILCGVAAVAGSSSVGNYVMIGGGVGISNQVHVGDGAKIGAMSLIAKDIPPGQTWVGNPSRPEKEHFKIHAWLNRVLKKEKNLKGSGS